MVRQVQIVAFAIIVIAVTAFNVSTVLDSNRSYDLSTTTIAAISGGEDGGDSGEGGNVDGEGGDVDGEGGDVDGEGGDVDGEGGGDISLNCTTVSMDIYYERSDCMACGKKHLVAKWDTKTCNKGVFSFCYPGYIRTYYDCDEKVTEVFDNTSVSTCAFIG